MENTDSLYPNTDRAFIKQDDIAYIAIEWVCSILAIIGNALVLLVYWSDRQKNDSQRIIHKYIVSMALADLLIGIIGIPTTIYVSVGLPHNRFWCLASLSSQTSFAMISVLALVATSTAKYMSLAYPLWFSTKFNDLWATLHILAHWFLGALIGWLPSIGLNNAPDKAPVRYRNNTNEDDGMIIAENDVANECESNSTHICYREFQCYYTEVIPIQMSMILMCGVILPSCLIMTVLYIRIYQIFKRTINRRTTTNEIPEKINCSDIFLSLFTLCCTTKQTPRKIGDLKPREIRTTIVLFVTVVFFVVCWCPLYIVDIISYFAPNSLHISLEGINAMITIRHVNSVLNPFLYAYHMKGFRHSAKHVLAKIFCCRKARHPGWNVKSAPSSTTLTSL